jgi:hypothetical protein
MGKSLRRTLVALAALVGAAAFNSTPALAQGGCTTCVLGCPTTEMEALMLCAFQCEGSQTNYACGGACGGAGSGWMVLSCQSGGLN